MEPGAWFEDPVQEPNCTPEQLEQYYPRPPQFKVCHEIRVGTIEELVTQFRKDLEATVLAQWEAREVLGVDDKKYNEIQLELSKHVGKYPLAPVTLDSY